MRIIVLMPTESIWSRNFVYELINLGHKVFVVDISPRNRPVGYLSKKEAFQLDDIYQFTNSVDKLFYINSRFGLLYNFVKRIFIIRKIQRREKTEAILSLYGGAWGLTAFLTQLRPLFIYMVGSDILLSTRLKLIITRRVIQSADFVFSNGIYLCKKAQEIAPKAKIENLYLGVDTNKYRPADELSTEKRYNTITDNLEFANRVTEQGSRNILIICTRGFEAIYNNKYLIDGLKEISKKGLPDFNIVFTSKGSLLNDIKEYTNQVLNQSQREQVKFLGGIPESMLIKYLKQSQIYVSLSKSDGASISLMEAFSCSLFPILSDIPANREWIYKNNGILVPLDKPKILAEAIVKAIENANWRNRAGKINREMILQNGSSDKNNKYFENKVTTIISEYTKNNPKLFKR